MGGPAENKGLVADEPGKRFEKDYKGISLEQLQCLQPCGYGNSDSSDAKTCGAWDTSDGQYAYQLFIDFDSRTVEVKAPMT